MNNISEIKFISHLTRFNTYTCIDKLYIVILYYTPLNNIMECSIIIIHLCIMCLYI